MSVFSGFAKWKNNTNHVNLVLRNFSVQPYVLRAAKAFA